MFFSNFTKTSVSFFLILQDKRDLPYERTNELRKPSQIYNDDTDTDDEGLVMSS